MKKLKCSSWGGDIKVDSDKDFGTCPYCGTKYKLNEDINVNIRLNDNAKEVLNNGSEVITGFSKTASSIIIIFAIGIIFVIVGICIFSFNGRSSSSNLMGETYHFNNQFIYDNGTQPAIFVASTMDEIIQSNKTNDRKVVLVFEGKETSDEKEIIDIKHSLDGFYEVSLNYDDAGFINKIVVDKVN